MKVLLICMGLILISPLAPAQSRAESPRMLNVQAVLLDEGGRVLRDLQEAEIEFSVIDGAGSVYYEETQRVLLVNGAISVLVGDGLNPTTGEPTGGIPYDALKPEGARLLRIQLAEHTIPQEEMELVSVPYSMYSQYAVELTKPIASEQILDGSVALVDLSDELVRYLNQSIAGISRQDLEDHKSETAAHPASSITVRTSLASSAQTNLQAVLDDIDSVLSIYQNQDDVLIDDVTTNANNIVNESQVRNDTDTQIATDLANESAARISNDNEMRASLADETSSRAQADQALDADITAEISARTSTDTNLQTQITNESGARTSADSTINSRISSHNHSGSSGSGGTIDHLSLNNRGAYSHALIDSHINNPAIHFTKAELTPADIDAAEVDHHHDLRYVNESGDDMTGNLNMRGNELTNVGDQNYEVGTKLAELDGRVTQLEQDPDVNPPQPIPKVIAWLRTRDIDTNSNTTSCTTNGIQRDYGLSCIQKAHEPGGYRIFFDQAIDSTRPDNAVMMNYIVQGNTWNDDGAAFGTSGAPNDLISIMATHNGYFEVAIWNVSAGPNNESRSDFMLSVIATQ